MIIYGKFMIYCICGLSLLLYFILLIHFETYISVLIRDQRC